MARYRAARGVTEGAVVYGTEFLPGNVLEVVSREHLVEDLALQATELEGSEAGHGAFVVELEGSAERS